MAIHSSILAWRIPRTEEPGGATIHMFSKHWTQLKQLSMHNLQCRQIQLLSHVQLFATPWTVARHSPLSMGFPRQEYSSGLPFSSPGDLPDSGIKLGSPELQADSLPTEPPGKTLDLQQILQLNIQNFLYSYGILNVFIVTGLIPGLGRCPGEGNSNPLQYSYLDNPMDREDWWLQSMG